MNRTLLLAAILSVGPLLADPLQIVLNPGSPTGQQGTILSIVANLTNTTPDELFLNGISVSGLDPMFSSNTAPFFSLPVSIAGSGSLPGSTLFNIGIPLNAPTGPYSLDFTIIGGADSGAADIIGSLSPVSFEVTPASTTVPEPASGLLLLAAAAAGLASRRKRSKLLS